MTTELNSKSPHTKVVIVSLSNYFKSEDKLIVRNIKSEYESDQIKIENPIKEDIKPSVSGLDHRSTGERLETMWICDSTDSNRQIKNEELKPNKIDMDVNEPVMEAANNDFDQPTTSNNASLNNLETNPKGAEDPNSPTTNTTGDDDAVVTLLPMQTERSDSEVTEVINSTSIETDCDDELSETECESLAATTISGVTNNEDSDCSSVSESDPFEDVPEVTKDERISKYSRIRNYNRLKAEICKDFTTNYKDLRRRSGYFNNKEQLLSSIKRLLGKKGPLSKNHVPRVQTSFRRRVKDTNYQFPTTRLQKRKYLAAARSDVGCIQ